MKRTYPRLPIEEFGRQLLLTGDLDPVYIALVRLMRQCNVPAAQIQRWCMAYFCLYHVGAACWLSEKQGPEFWSGLLDAALNDKPSPVKERWPRGHERRHFRGGQANKAVTELIRRYKMPEQFIEFVAGGGGPFSVVAERVKQHRGFGPWMAFKVGDVLERVFRIPVDFTEGDIFMFDSPREAALNLFRLKEKMAPETPIADEAAAICKSVSHLGKVFKDFKAPPHYDRPLNIQEQETIFCKWKSHMNGHYPLNNDITEIREGLQAWAGVSPMAALFLSVMPNGEPI